MSRAVSALVLLLVSVPAGATTLESLSTERLSRESSGVIVGRLTGLTIDKSGPLAFTVHSIEVVESWKGDWGRSVEVSLPGGPNQRFSGVPAIRPGVEYVIFLWTSPSGRTQITGLAQGLFEIHDTDDGPRRAVRALNVETLVLPGSAPAEPPAANWPLDQLRRRVLRAMSAEGEPAR